MLIFRPQDESYSIGRRRIALTETEANILHIFRQVMPGPVSREMILSRLYDAQTRPGAGAIDVFVSKLRQKLSLASEGREYIESIRGKGWALRPELCRIDAA
ncbi:MAG TPA: winged helix-turn-helix domain-containing protein [Sphingobium sp.]|nr:winged helix-turn-helix domain-containing protein [Sphingobium sp.]HUD92108.1 winged helix-turn-helix domain-containing protein [Sphingobium sp.]